MSDNLSVGTISVFIYLLITHDDVQPAKLMGNGTRL